MNRLNNSCTRFFLAMILCIMIVNGTCFAFDIEYDENDIEYDYADPDELEFGSKETVIFMDDGTVYIDGNFYMYTAYIGDYDYVKLSAKRDLYEWNSIEERDLCYWAENPNPEIPVCVRTADGETFESLTAAMHHIMGYLVRHETMPILVDLDIEW